MTMQASTVSFLYPNLCPNCSNYDSANQKCRVAAAAAESKLPSEVMILDLTGVCPYFEAGSQSTVDIPGEIARPTVEIDQQPPTEEPLIPEGEAIAGGQTLLLDEAARVVEEAEGALPAELRSEISIQEAAKIVPTPPTAIPFISQPAPFIPAQPAPPEAVTPIEPKPLGEARIHCPKCKVENAPNSTRCQNCGELLLPAETMGARWLYFVFGALLSAGCAYLFYRFHLLYPGSAPNVAYLDPVVLGVGAFVFLFTGFGLAVRRAPIHLKYEKRARRHLDLNLWQSLADVNMAMKTAPRKDLGRLTELRAQMYQKLRLSDEAARDRLALITSPSSPQSSAESVAFFTGVDEGTKASRRRRGQLNAVLNSGNVVAAGYCPRCKSVVDLDANEHCKVHPKIRGKNVEYNIAADALKGRLSVLGKVERRYPQAAAQLTGMIAVGETAVVGYCPKCRAAVQMDVERKCIVHPRVRGRWLTYVEPDSMDQGRQWVKEAKMKHESLMRERRNLLMLTIVAAVVLAFLVMQP